MLADVRGDARAIEAEARAAIKHFETARSELSEEADEERREANMEDNSNDLSSSFELLGLGLLAQGRAGDALAAYRKAMELSVGGSVAVNEGQNLFQIGRCHKKLNEHAEAAGRVRARDREALRGAFMAEELGTSVEKWLGVYLRRKWPAKE